MLCYTTYVQIYIEYHLLTDFKFRWAGKRYKNKMTEDSMVQEVFEQLKKAEKQTHDYWKTLSDWLTQWQLNLIGGSASNSLKTFPSDGKQWCL